MYLNYLQNGGITMKFQLKPSALTYQDLIEHIESQFNDESIQSNYWENKYNLTGLQKLLEDSIVVVEETAFFLLKDGLCAVDFETQDTPCMQSIIQLYEVEGIYEASKEMIEERIREMQQVIQSLEILSNLTKC